MLLNFGLISLFNAILSINEIDNASMNYYILKMLIDYSEKLFVFVHILWYTVSFDQWFLTCGPRTPPNQHQQQVSTGIARESWKFILSAKW